MKKIFIITLFIFILIGSFLNLSYAETNIMEENLNNLFYSNNSFYTNETTIDTSNTSLSSNEELSINTLQQENVVKVTNSITKLPQTGDFFNIKDILYIFIAFSATLLVIIAIKTISYKNVDKK